MEKNIKINYEDEGCDTKLIDSIKFDKKSKEWNDTPEWNECFIQLEERYFNTIITALGYIYLNDIYEMFDVKWNPDNNNQCIRKPITFETEEKEDGSITIYILYN